MALCSYVTGYRVDFNDSFAARYFQLIYIQSMRKLLLFFLLLPGFGVKGQQSPSDMILLKDRHGRTVKTLFSGLPIYFIDVAGRDVSGVIRKIARDSVFIQYYDIRKAYTQWGTSVMDTVTTFLIPVYYKEIKVIPKEHQHFEFVRDGTLFIIAGTGYAALHLINTAIQGGSVNGTSLAIAGGVAVTGLVMRKLRKKSYIVGKKYTLQYVNMQTSF